MKKQLIKNTLLAALLVGGMNLWSSCDSCSRKDGSNTEGTTTGEETNGDINGTQAPGDNKDSGNTPGTGEETGNPSGMNIHKSSSGRGSSSASGTSSSHTSAAPAAPAPKKMTEQQITDKVENSSSHATDSKGRPVNSGGTSGTGMGNGTISTGNNGKVSRLEDQKGD